MGLKAFQNEDADRFFGREQLTAKLVRLTRERPFIGVFGASGSGKSSLLRAGLVPRLDEALVFTPGVHPIDECAVRLAQLTGGSAVSLRAELADPAALGLRVKQHNADLVLVVDQFEEVFTLCCPEQRDWFVQALVAAPHVVIGVRADFYGHVGRHPELVGALEGAQLLVAPMTTDELRRAIVEPAQRAEATVETALVTRLVADVAGQSAAMPLVQHALVETWHRRRGMTLTLAGYEEAGGVEHAVARTAEAVFSDLTPEQQQTARGIFLRLIALGEGTEDTKRRAAREDLDADVLERLATARLVTLTEQYAELAHEALIRSWPRLRDWIAEDRDALRVHHQLTEAAAAWGGDRDLLYKGVRLAQAGELNSNSLSEPERAFLEASQADGRRRSRRTRVVVGALFVLVVLLASTAVFAVRKAGEATAERNAAVVSRAATEVMRLIPTDPRKAWRLALAAHAVAPGPATRDAVLNADAATHSRYSLPSDHRDGQLTFSTNGEFVIQSGRAEPATVLFRGKDPAAVGIRIGDEVRDVVLSADDRRAFTVEMSGTVQIWDLIDLQHPVLLGVLPRAPDHLTVSREGTVAAGTVQDPDHDELTLPAVWDLRNPAQLREIALPRQRRVLSVAAAPSGREVVVTWQDDDTRATFAGIWGFDGDQPRLRKSVRVGDRFVSASVSDSGRFLAVRSMDDLVVWDLAGEPAEWVTLPGMSDTVAEFAISRDDRQVAVLNDAVVRVWDLTAKGAPALAGFSGDVYGLRYREREDGFGVVDRKPSVWTLRTDLDKVERGLCREQDVQLSDAEWRRFLPEFERVPVC